MPGRPLSPQGLVPYLLEHGIEVGIAPQGIDDFTPAMAAWAVQNLRFDAGWVRFPLFLASFSTLIRTCPMPPHTLHRIALHTLLHATTYRTHPPPHPTPPKKLVSSGLPTPLALSLASSNIDKLLGVHANPQETDLVVTRDGGFLEFEGKVVAVISPGRGVVDLF